RCAADKVQQGGAKINGSRDRKTDPGWLASTSRPGSPSPGRHTMRKQRLVVFSGAGVSAESGLRTFRDADGLWERYPIVEVATPEAWQRDPRKVLHFYDLRRA